jgi:hypothetical protein
LRNKANRRDRNPAKVVEVAQEKEKNRRVFKLCSSLLEIIVLLMVFEMVFECKKLSVWELQIAQFIRTLKFGYMCKTFSNNLMLRAVA